MYIYIHIQIYICAYVYICTDLDTHVYMYVYMSPVPGLPHPPQWYGPPMVGRGGSSLVFARFLQHF